MVPPRRPSREGVVRPVTPYFRLLVDENGLTDALLDFVTDPRGSRNDRPVIQDLHDLLGVGVDVVSSGGLRSRHDPIRDEAVDL